MGLICVVNVVLPWDHSKSEKTFQIQEILMGAPVESLGFKAKNY